MITSRSRRLVVLMTWMVVLPPCARPQAQPPVPISVTELDFVKKDLTWPIAGRVTNLSGNPVGGARVLIDMGKGPRGTKTIETDLQGEFHAEFKLEAETSKKVNVRVAASKQGYRDASESEDFDADSGSKPFDLVLREETDDPDLLSQSELLAGLAPKLRGDVERRGLAAPARGDYARAAEALFGQHDAQAAISILAKLARHEPYCSDCRTLLAVALLEAGSWTGVRRELSEATTVAAPEAVPAEPYIIFGILETWQGEREKAAEHLAQALRLEPANPLALQEYGRVLFFGRKWEQAAETLQKAIKAGASGRSHLLRARVLLETGDNQEAEAEMNAYLAGRKPAELPPAERLVCAQLADRLTVLAYEAAKSVVDRPVDELVRLMPELRGIDSARSQDELPGILARVGETVDAFFRRFPNTMSLEDVRSEILRGDGRVAGSFDEKFQYLILSQSEKWGLGLTEYRTAAAEENGEEAKHAEGFMRTAGFTSASIVFHPAYQSGVNYRLLGRQVLEGRPYLVLAFAQDPRKSVIVLRFEVNKVSIPLLQQGLAWVDPATYQITRMRTDVYMPPSAVKLRKQTTEIQFEAVQFKELPSALLLPSEVSVTVEWKKIRFRNLHNYSDYRLFNVETEEKMKGVLLAPQAPPRAN